MKRKILIAAAWPYANGSLHLGHAAALIAGDVLARYFRLKGDDVLYVSGSDCHGTPIAVEAERQGVHPAVIANYYHEEFVKTLLDGLSFSYDNYTKTTTENHFQVIQEIFLKLYNDGLAYLKKEELPYCQSCNRFLPDRYIEGQCPECGFDSARGDQCDNCGKLMDVKKLIKSKCKNCGNVPVWKESEHFFFKLTSFEDRLKKWVASNNKWRQNAKNFTLEFLNQGLTDRAITRDTDWGVPIPLSGYDYKRIYVWFEAVCGYFSASKEWAKIHNQPEAWRDFWENPQAIHYYVHGKDNIPFHTIIWPAILMGTGNLHLPDRIISSEYLTLEKKQFSKSRHWAVWLPDFLAEFDSETLRYYLIANGSETADADFSWKEFMTKINNELIGNFGNYVNRVLSFIEKNFPEGVSLKNEKENLFFKKAEQTFQDVSGAIEAGKFREGLRLSFKLAEEGNRYINEIAPWLLIKTDREKTENSLAIAVHIIKCLAILVNPFLPKTSEKICNFLGIDLKFLKWQYPLPEKIIVGKVAPLYDKITEEAINKQIEKLGKESIQ